MRRPRKETGSESLKTAPRETINEERELVLVVYPSTIKTTAGTLYIGSRAYIFSVRPFVVNAPNRKLVRSARRDKARARQKY